MRVLVLSFYYPPDLSAGSFRASSFVEALMHKIPPDSTIDVLTTLPNRYESFSIDAPQVEHSKGLNVRRIPLPAHKSGMLDQSRSFLTFSRCVLDCVASQDYDAIFATSSRLMTAVLAAWISTRKKAPLYLDIRDIFVDTIGDILSPYLAKTMGPIFGMMERWAINKAARVNLVSPGFSDYFSGRYSAQRFSFFTNGIDDEFVKASYSDDQNDSVKNAPLRVLYAGNIGEGQGLHEIIPTLARRMSGKVCFRIIGDGGRKSALLSALSSQGTDNVEFLSPVNRTQLISEYKNADVLFLHLNAHDAFKKVLPSKIFEYGAMGKPIWAGVAGYAAEFLRSEVSNAVVFSPCNAQDAEDVFDRLTLHDVSRRKFIKKYSRENIMESMAVDFLDAMDLGGE